MNNDWNFDGFDIEQTPEEVEEKKPRRRAAAQELSLEYLYRRAFSEVSLWEALQGIEMKKGICVNVMSGGNIDQLTYLTYFVRQGPIRDVVISTWCMSAEDARQLIEWCQSGKLQRLHLYVGEIFKSSYGEIYEQLANFFSQNPDKGDVNIFRCHAKIIAGRAEKYDFAVQSSANMDTNPRTENACIQISSEAYKFYYDYFF